jgi:methylase of polypeptide subunit release factors
VSDYRFDDRITLIKSDLFAALTNKRYDLILCNPPYVTDAAMARLPKEYAHEPKVALAGGPDGRPVVLFLPTWSGSPDAGETWTAPFLEMGTVLATTVEERTYGGSLTIQDPFVVSGRRVVIDTCWVPSIESRVIELFIEAMDDAPSPGCAILTHEFNGAASRVPANATAFGLREDHVLVEILAMWDESDDRDENQRHEAWVRRTLRSFAAIALPGGYPNLLPSGDTERAAQSYGPNLERLIRAKRRYDPEHIFSSAIPIPMSSS